MLLRPEYVLFVVVFLYARCHYADGFFLPSFLTNESRMFSCMKCQTAVSYAKKLVASGASEEELELAAISICVDHDLVPRDVCVDMVKLATPQVAYVLNATKHDSKTICNTLFGFCKSKLPSWSVYIPVNKPDVTPPVMGNSTYRILHLSDTHYEPEYTEGSPATCAHPFCCRVWGDQVDADTTYAGRWGAESGRCDPPLRTLEAALSAAAHLKPDLIYVTGDLSPHVVWMLDEDSIRASVVDTAAAIRRYFPDTPVAYTLGNHESVPVNSFPVPAAYPEGYDMDWLYPLLETVWGDAGVPESAMETVLKGGYYHWSPVPGLRVVSINVNYGFHENWFLLVDHVDPTGQIEWLTQVLMDAEAVQEKVHIIGHIAWGSLLDTYSHMLNKLLSRFESTVTGIFVGHSHLDEIQLHWNVKNNQRPVGVSYLGPSISSDGVKSPSFRLYEVDGPGGSWTVRDSLTYSMNLTLANAGADPDFPLAYSAKEVYGLPDLSPSSWADVVFKMAKDRELFDEYFRHYHSFWAEPADLADCKTKCQKKLLCDMVSGNKADDKPCKRIQNLVPRYNTS